MYLEYFGLSRLPFQITPDVRFFYGSRAHNRALATVTYGLSKNEGFVVITGEVGAGKTTLIEYLLASGRLGKTVTARINTTQLESENLLQLIVYAFGRKPAATGKAANLRDLNEFFLRLARGGRRALLIVDEVQNLSSDALEELRMLSNFQSGEEPLLQMLLVGQPEFRARLAGAECEQIRQRVIASYHLSPLPADDVQKYIEHRLALAGWNGEALFTAAAYERIQSETGGVPRKVNRVCDRLLLYAYLEDSRCIDETAAHAVIDEMRTESLAGTHRAEPVNGEADAVCDAGQAKRPDARLRLHAPPQGMADADQPPADVERLRNELAVYRNKLARVVDYVARAEKRLRGGMN